MDDFIRREAAIDAVDVGNLHRGIVNALQEIISDIPAADVRPVLHAEWEQVMGKYDYLFRCSRCHFVPIEPHYFCPNCGADMREVDADG